MSALRDEIIEAEKGRADLLKWKLIIVSALGAAALGFTGQRDVHGAPFLLLLIPAVCLYVDLMCRHLSLRIIVIGTFLRLYGWDEERSYERFVSHVRREQREQTGIIQRMKEVKIFAFEDWALALSTIVMSGFVVAAGWILPAMGVVGSLAKCPFCISGGLGILFTILMWWLYDRRFTNIEQKGQ